MATPLDTSVLIFLVPVFVFILIFIAIYAMLQKTKLLGDNKGLQALSAFIVGLIFMTLPPGRAIVMLGTPWLIFFGMIIVGIVTFMMFFGVKEEKVAEALTGSTMMTITISFVVIVFLVILSKVYGPFLLVDGAPTFWGAVKRTLFTSKVLGTIFLLAVASFVVRWLPGSIAPASK